MLRIYRGLYQCWSDKWPLYGIIYWERAFVTKGESIYHENKLCAKECFVLWGIRQKSVVLDKAKGEARFTQKDCKR